MTDEHNEGFWDTFYRSHDIIWSGNPNPHLVHEAGALHPGRALDAGCGEGADAIWLAERGWHVTAVDISSVALQRGAAQANERGATIAQRIDWLQTDVGTWVPATASYDFVSAQFLHLPKEPRDALYRRLAAAVAPKGTLLVVGHHPSDLEIFPRPWLSERLFTAADVAALLDPQHWDIIVSDARARSVTAPDGQTVTLHDAILRAWRRN